MPRLAARPGAGTAASRSRAAGRFWSHCWGTLTAPRRTTKLISSSATAGEGITIASAFGCLYSLAALTSYLAGRKPRGRVLKGIPAERYYLAQSLFTLPVTLLWFTLLAASARQLSKRAGGAGSFGSDFTMLAFTQSVPMIAAMWLPDMACYLLRVDERMYRRLVPAYGSAAMVWAAALSARGLSVSEGMPWPVALRTVVAAELGSAIASGVPVVMR